MATIFFQYVTIQSKFNLPNSVIFARVGFKFCRIVKKLSQNSQDLFESRQSGNIFPNLITLLESIQLRIVGTTTSR